MKNNLININNKWKTNDESVLQFWVDFKSPLVIGGVESKVEMVRFDFSINQFSKLFQNYFLFCFSIHDWFLKWAFVKCKPYLNNFTEWFFNSVLLVEMVTRCALETWKYFNIVQVRHPAHLFPEVKKIVGKCYSNFSKE